MNMDEPEAYTIGWQPFLGLKIYLDSRPLIPRPETEWWTDQLLTHMERQTSHISFLDLCAGSGAIGCAALARIPNARVYFGEIDSAHETTILKNIGVNNLDESRSDIRIGDLFNPFSNMKFNVIAANPPYIPNNRILQASVANYEPGKALYAGADGLDVIRRIADELSQHLTEDGEAWIECDSEHALNAGALFVVKGLHSKIRTDQYGEPRIVVVSLP